MATELSSARKTSPACWKIAILIAAFSLPLALHQSLILFAADDQIEDMGIRGKNYVVVPWNKTELQMDLIGSAGDPKEDHTAYVLIDGNSLYKKDGSVDDGALDWDQLANQLRPFSRQTGSIVEFRVLNFQVNSTATHLLGWALDGFGRSRAGFNKAYVAQFMAGPGSFWQTVDSANEKRKHKVEGPELPVGDELTQVYPVETFISCIVSHEADCVVRIVPRLTKNTGNALPVEIRESILQHVPQANVGQKGKILFLLSFEKAAIPSAHWFQEKGADELARMLSFNKGGVNMAEY